MMNKVALGADDAGTPLKEVIRTYLEERGIPYDDYTPPSHIGSDDGTNSGGDCDYPDIALKVAQAIASGKYRRGILVCGTGIGMAIAANKVPGVYAALAHDTYSAERARKSNNAQVLTMGARVIGPELAKSIVQTWLDSEFAGGPSTRKIAKIKRFEAHLSFFGAKEYESSKGGHVVTYSLKYQGVIQEIGSMVPELLPFLPYGLLIFFSENVPEELRGLSLVHNGTQLVSELAAGDYLKFSPPSDTQQSRPHHLPAIRERAMTDRDAHHPHWYRLTSVGESVNANLAELGHVVIHFDGATTANLPGAISVEPALEALPTVGTTFEFFGLKE